MQGSASNENVDPQHSLSEVHLRNTVSWKVKQRMIETPNSVRVQTEHPSRTQNWKVPSWVSGQRLGVKGESRTTLTRDLWVKGFTGSCKFWNLVFKGVPETCLKVLRWTTPRQGLAPWIEVGIRTLPAAAYLKHWTSKCEAMQSVTSAALS